MADLAQKAEMRRRRILMKSEERMKKLLGPNTPTKDMDSTHSSLVDDPHPVIKVPCSRTVCTSIPKSSSTAPSNKLQDHKIHVMKSKRRQRDIPDTPCISDMIVFPVGVVTTVVPSYFVPILLSVTLLILVQTSACPEVGFYATLLCGILGIDHRKSFGLKVLGLLEKALQVFFMFSFSFIATQAVILWVT